MDKRTQEEQEMLEDHHNWMNLKGKFYESYLTTYRICRYCIESTDWCNFCFVIPSLWKIILCACLMRINKVSDRITILD